MTASLAHIYRVVSEKLQALQTAHNPTVLLMFPTWGIEDAAAPIVWDLLVKDRYDVQWDVNPESLDPRVRIMRVRRTELSDDVELKRYLATRGTISVFPGGGPR